ncbi:MAG: DNA-packaging protein [Thermoleophilia bacterium]
MSESPLVRLSNLPATERAAILASLSDEDANLLYYDWQFWARPQQLAPPGEWLVWLVLAGRGYGKTRVGAEFIRAFCTTHPRSRAALVAATFADGRDAMVEGDSGLLSVTAPAEMRGGKADAAWNRSLGELYFANGSRARIYSSEKPGQLRGPQHGVAWCDEAAKFADASSGTTEDTTWSNLMMGLRLGSHPRCVVTTTPRPNRLIKQIIDKPMTVTTRGTTFDNLENLAPTFRAEILSQYEGTRLARQELYAEILEDVPGALWTLKQIEDLTVDAAPELARIVVAIDPAVSSKENSDETGIVAAGVDSRSWPHGYVLADVSGRYSPDGWARRAIALYHSLRADCIVAESNQGGDMVRSTLQTADDTVPVKLVVATHGKRVRAEPIAAMYEQGRVHHVGSLDVLDDQMAGWVPDMPGNSPDRLDAMVWALTELMLTGSRQWTIEEIEAYGRDDLDAIKAMRNR